MIEEKEYQNCRLHHVDIRKIVFSKPQDYNIVSNFENSYYIKDIIPFLKTIKSILSNTTLPLNCPDNLLNPSNLEQVTNPTTSKTDDHTIMLSLVNTNIKTTIEKLLTNFNKTKRKFVSTIITKEKIIHFCLYFRYKEETTVYIVSFIARLMDIYNLMRMFKTFNDDIHPNSEYIITYHGLAHTYTYYYFLLFIQLPENRQQELLKQTQITIMDITNNTEINFETNKKSVKIKDIVRNKGEVPFESYGHLIDDFVEDFPIKVQGGVEIEDDNDELNV